jgi:hypothetical protein
LVVPFGTEVVVIVSGTEAIAMLRGCVAVLLAASVTFTVNDEVPEAVGVPEIAPEEVKLKPAGSEPLLMLQE